MASVVSPFDDTPEVVSAQQLKLRVTIAVHGLLNQIDLQANKGRFSQKVFIFGSILQTMCQISILIMFSLCG